MAEKKKIQRRLEEMQSREELWAGRARMAVDKGRDDLAREALIEKKRFNQMIESLEQELIDNNALVNRYHDDIRELEDKLGKAREKQRILVQRSIRARQAKQAQEEIRRMDNYETIAKFDELENRIERMEAEADLVNFGRKPDLEEEFEELMVDDDIERELASLKASEAETEKNSARER